MKMIIFVYDKTFDGLLTAVFDAYVRKEFPDMLVGEGAVMPLFYDKAIAVCTDVEKANRVWKGLQKKLSKSALEALSCCWLSELPGVDELLFRYIRKAIDAPKSIEVNFGDSDVLEFSQIYKKVNYERLRMLQFVRFQKTKDNIFYAIMEPLYSQPLKSFFQ